MKNERSKSAADGPVWVTGANGFIGRHVARLFAQRGHTVVGIGHGAWSPAEFEAWGLRAWHQGEVNGQSLQALEGPPGIIVHCAGGGSVAFSIEQPLADFDRTVSTTAHVLEFARLHAPGCRIVYPSSASVYGTVSTMPIAETQTPAPVSQYGTHKLMAEQMVVSYARQFGMSTSIVRLFSVYGAGLRKQLLWDACCKFRRDDCTFMGTGEEVRDWLHVEDAAELLALAAEMASPACPTVNGGSGTGVSVKSVLTALGACFTPPRLPGFSGVQRTGDPSRYVAAMDVASCWGWHPARDWKSGVAEYAAWWRQTDSDGV